MINNNYMHNNRYSYTYLSTDVSSLIFSVDAFSIDLFKLSNLLSREGVCMSICCEPVIIIIIIYYYYYCCCYCYCYYCCGCVVMVMVMLLLSLLFLKLLLLPISYIGFNLGEIAEDVLPKRERVCVCERERECVCLCVRESVCVCV